MVPDSMGMIAIAFLGWTGKESLVPVTVSDSFSDMAPIFLLLSMVWPTSAGVAGAICAARSCQPRELKVAELQAALRADGVDLDVEVREQEGLR